MLTNKYFVPYSAHNRLLEIRLISMKNFYSKICCFAFKSVQKKLLSCFVVKSYIKYSELSILSYLGFTGIYLV